MQPIKIILLILLSLNTGHLFAQQLGFSYQAIAINRSKAEGFGKDSQGEILADTDVSLRFSLLEGSEAGAVVYDETHQTTTDIFGIFRLVIGRGITASSVDLEDLQWGVLPYFLQVEIDLGNGFVFLGVEELLGAAYALNSSNQSLSLQGNELSISGGNSVLINDTDDTNELQTISLSGSTLSLSNGGGSIILPSDSVADFNTMLNIPANLDIDATDDFDGQYSNLTGVPLNVSDFANDAGYLTTEVDGSLTNEIQAISLTGSTISLSNGGGSIILPSGSVADFNTMLNTPANLDIDATDDFDGQYSNLSGVPTVLSSFTNDLGFLSAEVDGSITNEIQAISLTGSTISLSNGGGSIILPSGSVADFNTMLNIPANLDIDATDDFDGQYTNLTGAPLNVSAFANDAAYLTTEIDGSVTNEIQAISLTGSTISLSNGGGSIILPSGSVADFNTMLNIPANLDIDATNDFDGQYTNLTGAPLNVSDFANDAAYLTTEIDGSVTNEIQAISLTGSTISLSNGGGSIILPSGSVADFNTMLNIPANLDIDATDDFDGQYSNLSGVPVNVSDFANDAGYLTTEVDGSITNEIQAISLSGSTVSLSNGGGSITLPAGSVADFNTMINIPANLDLNATDDFDGQYTSLTGAPLNVSDFANDAGYLATEVDGSITNEIQAISLSGSTLSLSNGGGSVTLPAGSVADFNTMINIPANLDLDATDDYDGQYSNLSGAPTALSSFTNDLGYLTAEVDGSVINEIQAISLTGSTISLSNGGGSIILPSGSVADFNTMINIPTNLDLDATDDFDGQYSNLSGVPTALSSFTNDAGFLTTEVDGSITNEIQDLQIASDKLSITGNVAATGIDLSAYLDAVFATSSGVTSNSPGNIATDDFVFGSASLDDITGTGDDSRMFFDKSKGAFRVGYADGVQFDQLNVGNFSAALGYNCFAVGQGSSALGQGSVSAGDYSFSAGYNSNAMALGAIAMGNNTQSDGNYSVSIGNQTNASGNNSLALGQETQATEIASLAGGYQSTASGQYSVVIGYQSQATGNYSTAFGNNTEAAGQNSFSSGMLSVAQGLSATAMGSAAQAIGNYSASFGNNTRADGISSVAIGVSSIATGDYSIAMGNANTASGIASVSLGENSQAANYSIAAGLDTEANGSSSVAMGNGTIADGESSTAFGNGSIAGHRFTTASGLFSAAMGESSTAIGEGTYARTYGEVAVGLWNNYNLGFPTSGYNISHRLFVVGNGQNVSARSDAFIIYKSGNAWLSGILTQASDKRLKRNIYKVSESLSTLSLLDGVHYYWNDIKPRDTTSLQTGFIAQEVEKVFPELVKEDSEGYKSVNYTGFIPHLVEAVKILHAKNEQLKTEYETQKIESEQNINSLEVRLEALEKLVNVQLLSTRKVD